MKRFLLLALVALLVVLFAYEAFAVPAPDFAKRVPTPLFAVRVPAPVFLVASVPVVAVVKSAPRTPVRTAMKWVVRKVRICDGTSCRIVEERVAVPVDDAAPVKPAGDAKKAAVLAPAPAGCSGCAGGVCRPALRLGILRRR